MNPTRIQISVIALKLGPAVDFEDELGQLVDVTQLATDLATGQCSLVASSQPRPSTPLSAPEDLPYISPAWLPSFIKHFVALSNHSVPRLEGTPRRQTVLEICTETVSRTLIYRPEQLVLLCLDMPTISVQEFVHGISERDLAAGGFLMRFLRDLPSNAPPCIDASTRIVLNPVQEDSSTTEFRMQHQLHREVGLHVVHIAQPDGNPVTHTPASFLTSRYAYERDILAFLPHGGFGAVYVHYARYRILSRIAGEVGLQINKPSQESSTNTVPLTYLDLLAWAGVNAGSFGNEKALIMRCEQLRWELSLQDNPTAANAVLRNHLNALAAEPVRSMTSRDPSLAWSVADLRARLPANVIGPRHHYQHRRG
ncbi:hypothetical protein B0H10DRAFT_1959733 [Mycena sp. CBHHK59/15]|nr:hypothetical protein B0H10DRAFT_1959733 [Mycena sp. CBHHK59/15]